MAKKKPSAARKAAKGHAPDAQRTRLHRMLIEAIDQVDAEGLLFLLRQANTLIHNQKVDEVNRELEELSERSPGPRAQKPRNNVEIEDSGNRSAVFITLGPARKVLNREELKRLVRVCYAAESKSAALQQLFTVLTRERSDILKDAGIAGPGSPLLDQLFHALRDRYHL